MRDVMWTRFRWDLDRFKKGANVGSGNDIIDRTYPFFMYRERAKTSVSVLLNKLTKQKILKPDRTRPGTYIKIGDIDFPGLTTEINRINNKLNKIDHDHKKIKGVIRRFTKQLAV